MDWGDARVGFALCDPEERLALPHGMARVKTGEDALAAVMTAVAETGAEEIVLGLPLNMDGRKGPRARATEDFAGRLREAGFVVALWDERLTTAEAGRRLKEAGHSRRGRRDRVDALAAQRLLESYLASRRHAGSRSGIVE